MKNKNLPRTIFLLLFIVLLHNVSAQNEAQMYWQEHMVKKIREYKTIRFTTDMYTENLMDSEKEHIATKEYIVTPDCIFVNQDYESFYCTNDSLKLVDRFNGVLLYGSSNPDTTFYQFNAFDLVKLRRLQTGFDFFKFYFYPRNNQYANVPFETLKDTTVNGVPFAILSYNKYTGNAYNENTQAFDLPQIYTVEVYYNKQTNRVDRILFTPSTPEMIQMNPFRVEILFTEFASDDKKHLSDSIFNFKNPEYRNFSLHNIHIDLPATECGISSDSNEISETMLNYPIVSMYNDTILLKNIHEWVLIDFWFYGCKPCMHLPVKLQKEKNELGYRVLEKEKIKILYLNPKGNATEIMKQFVERWGITDITYSAKEITQIFDVLAYPQYFLISPDKKIVYQSSNLEDYSELLKAKQEYENNRAK